LEEAHASDRFSRSQLLYLLTRANGAVLVAEEAEPTGPNLVVGNAIVLFRRGGSAGHLYSLTVDPEHQGRGLGRLLLGRVEELAAEQGCERLLLEVRSDNEAALRLYRASGYREVGIRPGYYADGRDALAMEKSI
jgi:ribosomal-protein-alanine N-acetyltransferase